MSVSRWWIQETDNRPPNERCRIMASEKDERETNTVVMYRDLVGMVRTIAGHRGLTMAETWEKYGRPAMLREYRKVLDEMQAVILGGEG